MSHYDPDNQLGSEPPDRMQEAFGALVWLATGVTIISAICAIWSWL